MLMVHHAACLQAVTHVTIAVQHIFAMPDCANAIAQISACWPTICVWACHHKVVEQELCILNSWMVCAQHQTILHIISAM